MSKRFALSALAALMLLAFSAPANAQANMLAKGGYSVSFALPGGGGALVGGKYYLAKNAAVGLDLGYSIAILDDQDDTGGFTILPSYTYYLMSDERLLTFVKGALNITKLQGIDFGDAITLDLGGFFGVEFFVTPEFSIAGEMGLAINFRNEFKTITSQVGKGSLFAQFFF